MRMANHMLIRSLKASAATSAAILALAIGGPAAAQGVNGTGTIVSGSGTIVSAPNSTRVVTTSAQTIVNWRPTDTAAAGGPINFLPAGNNLAFEGFGNYIVLNRFTALDPVTGLAIPINRQIGLFGNVTSINGPSGPRSGNIWFYNAGGFLIGNGGAINVGGLVLTANDIDTTGGLTGPGGVIRFRGAAGSTSAIQIDAGASIITGQDAVPGSSYVAIVAPRIVQRGVVDVDGSIAYVAAEQADITVNNGLFDINVLVGAEGGTVIDHSGTTTGTAQRDADGRESRIYMVAIPKNDAVSMLVSGQVGYRDPVTAQVEPNGQIRLAAGYNIVQGEVTQQPGSAAAADMTLRDIIFNSELFARASNNLAAAPVGTIPTGFPAAAVPPPQQGILRFNQDAMLVGDASATLTIRNQQGVIAASNLSVVSGGRGAAPGRAEVNLAYDAALPGNRPALAVAGALLIDAARVADPFAGGDATGGIARLSVNGGLVNAGSILLLATGTAGFGSAAQGGNGQGGTAEAIIDGAGALVQTNFLELRAGGFGRGDRFNPNLGLVEIANAGGSGTGGSALVSVSGGASLNAQQGIALDAAGSGGTGSLTGGTGTGGTARLAINGAASNVTTALTNIAANGDGGGPVSVGPSAQSDIARGGDARGGTAEIVSNGTGNLGTVFITAFAIGGAANIGANIGGNARGGSANLLTSGGALAMTQLQLGAGGIGGSGTDLGAGFDDVSGEGIGGTVAVRSNAGTITITGDVNADAQGTANAGAADEALARQGGTIEFRAENGGTISATGVLTANATGGFDSSNGSGGRRSGGAQGGSVTLESDNGTVSFASANVRADGLTADSTVQNGNATGGTITLRARNGGTVALTNTTGFSEFSTIGFAGSGVVGGQGRGGSINLLAEGGSVQLAGATVLNASGTSGTSSSATVAAPAGQGGSILLRASDAASMLGFGMLTALTNGRAGQLNEGGVVVGGNAAGQGSGGTITLDISGGTVTGDQLELHADGFGGSGNTVGGDGRGGNILVTLGGGTLTLNALTVTADGEGGVGSATARSGDGFGGRVELNFNGTNAAITTFTASADGDGGDGSQGQFDPLTGLIVQGGNGGNGVGGTLLFNMNAGRLATNLLTLQTDGNGGDGGAFDAFSGNFGNSGSGGNGTGGTVSAFLAGGALQAGSFALNGRGTGGDGGGLLFSPGPPPVGTSVGGAGGSGTGGTARLVITGATGNGGAVAMDASGAGGDGSNGFGAASGAGGNAQGGLVNIQLLAGAETINGASLFAAATGGDGGSTILTSAGPGGAGGAGGNARGGTVRVEASGAGTAATITNPNVRVDGLGGAGGTGAGNNVPFGSRGGGGNGGTIAFVAQDNGRLTLNAAGGLSANGIGGAGGQGAQGNSGTEENSPAAPGGNGADGTNPGAAGGNGQNGAAGSNGGRGGTGSNGGRGGDGTGGNITLTAASGGAITNNIALFTVTGQGGQGGQGGIGGTGGNGQTGGNGGNGGAGGPAGPGTPAGRGGDGGNGGAGGNGGDGGQGGVGGDGGRGFGGTVTLQTNNGTIAAGNVQVNASGLGGAVGTRGEGGRGGIGGIGGSGGLGGPSALASGAPGSAGPSGSDGGAGPNGDINNSFAGGTGGSIIFRTQGINDRITAANMALTSNANDSSGALRGAAGTIMFDVQSPAGTTPIEIANLTINALGGTGNAANQAVNLDAGAGQIVVTGALTITSSDSVRLGATTGIVRAGGDLRITSGGTIAVARAAAGDDIILIGGDMQLGDLRALGTGPDGEADGSDFRITTTGNVTIDHAEAAGDFLARITGNFTTGLTSIITGGNIDIVTGGDSNLGNSTAGGSITVAAGGRIGFANLVSGLETALTAATDISGGTAASGQDFRAAAGTGLTLGSINAGATASLRAGGGPVGVTTIVAGGDVLVDGAGTVTLGSTTANGTFINRFGQQADGNVFVIADGAITMGPTNARTSIGVRGTNLIGTGQWTAGEDIFATASGTAALGALSAGDNVDVTANGSLTTAAVTARGTARDDRAVQFNPGGAGPRSFALAAAAADGSDIALTSTTGGVAANTLNAAGDAILRAGQAVTASAITAAGRVDINGASGITVPQINTPGQVLLTSTNGAIRVDGNLVAGGGVTADGRSLFLRASGPLTLTNGRASAGDIDIAAQGDLRVQAANASGALTLSSARTATIDGIATGTSITLASADIVITGNGRLGTLGTTQSLARANNDRAAAAFIGGTGARNGWHLDSGEITRLFGANITLDGGAVTAAGSNSIGSARAPDIVVDDFTVNAAQQFGPAGSFAIVTTGKLRVVGDARFTDMADAQSVRLRADDALEVIMGEGSVVLNGAGTALGGVLRLQSADVIVASRAAITDVAAATTLDAITDRLALNDGFTSDLGALVAKGIEVTAGNSFFVQNSGLPGVPRADYANRRGLTFGTLGLNIAFTGGQTAGGATGRIAINGQHIGAAGPVTGLDTIALISINGVQNGQTGFDPQSSANGCLILGILACRVSPDSFPVQDPIEQGGGLGAGGLGGTLNPFALITLRDVDPLSGEPLIDDPVTGAGNEDLWIFTDKEEEDTK